MASSGLNKILDFIILYTHKSYSENVCPVILFLDTKKQMICHKLGIWYAQADVIAWRLWKMLKPLDVMTSFIIMADIIAKMS